MSSSTVGICALADCPINQGQAECLEGHDPLTLCPNLTAPDELPGSEAEPAPTSAVPTPTVIPMWSGRPLSGSQAEAVTLARRARVVLIAGVAESGKTTMMASLFDRFQRGPFAEMRFAGSRTLMAFEERCFDSRLASGRREFTTPRTRVGEGPQLLHLDLQRVEDGETLTLLLPDLAAERFSAAIDSVAAWRELPVIDRIDRLVVLVDGERLIANETRWEATSDSRTLVRGALESGVAAPAQIDIVVTKWDMVVAGGAEAAGEEAAGAVAEAASSGMAPFVRAAARSTRDDVPIGLGLAELLERWLAPLPRTRDSVSDATTRLQGERAFVTFASN